MRSGILLLDKPLGLSSAAAVARVKRLFAARKAGHTGRSSIAAPPPISAIGASTRALPTAQPSPTASPWPAPPPFQCPHRTKAMKIPTATSARPITSRWR